MLERLVARVDLGQLSKANVEQELTSKLSESEVKENGWLTVTHQLHIAGNSRPKGKK